MRRALLLVAAALVLGGCHRPVPSAARHRAMVRTIREYSARVGPSGEGPRQLAFTEEYDARGDLAKSVDFSGGKPVTTVTCTFDDRRRLSDVVTVSTQYGSYYRSRSRSRYGYDSSGPASTEEVTEVSRSKPRPGWPGVVDTTSLTRHFYYDASGRVSSLTFTGVTAISGMPSRMSGRTTNRRDANGRLVEMTAVFGGRTERTEYSHDSTGRTTDVREYTTTDDGKLRDRLGRTDHFEYDSQGNLALSRMVMSSATTTVTYSGYRLDAHGKWVQRTVDERYVPPDSMAARYARRPAGTYVEYCEIAYYGK